MVGFLRWAHLIVVTALIAGVVASPAGAVPWRYDEPGPDGTFTMPWRGLGLPSSIDFVNTSARQDYTVPLPLGLNATRLRGVIRPSANLRSGYLQITDARGTFLGAVNVPPVAADQISVPFDVDISAAHVANSSVELSFTVQQLDGGDGRICGPPQQLAITDLAVVYGGAEPAATTIATFFPPVLQQVTIYAPTDSDAAEQQAVLTLASAVTQLYIPQPLAVRVVNQGRGEVPPAASEFNRAIVVERGDEPGISVVNPGAPDVYLRLSGRGDQLSAQSSVLVNQLQSLAQVPTARTDQPGARTVLATDTLTFSQLGMKGKTSVLGTGYLSVAVDRAALGIGRVDSLRVHLLADYTPVAKDDAGTMVVRANDVVVYTQTLDGSGHVDSTFELARQQLRQRISLDFVFTYTPHASCSPMTAPMTFQVDPRSTLTVRRGGEPLSGFAALPSEFSPHFLVAMDGSGPDQLNYAAQVIADIARQSSAQLLPRVVDVKTAASDSSGALIVANSATLSQTGLNPPLGGDGSTVTVDLPTKLKANIDQGIGSVQAFADDKHGRSVVLVTTTGAWSLVDPLFGYIDKLDNGWTDLTGDVLAAGAEGTPTNVTIRQDSNIFGAQQPDAWKFWLAVSAGFAVLLTVVMVVVIGWVWLLRRRRRSS